MFVICEVQEVHAEPLPYIVGNAWKVVYGFSNLVKHSKIKTLELTNEKIKGQIKILKISEDDNLINGNKKGTPIENVEFEIRKEDGELVEKIVTDKEGIAISSNLEKGSYIIRETKAHKDYKISNEEFKIQIEHHKKIEEITITNISKEPEKPKLPRTGF